MPKVKKGCTRPPHQNKSANRSGAVRVSIKPVKKKKKRK